MVKSRFTCTFTHTCCFYSGSTHPHTSTHFHIQIHPKLFYSYLGENSQKHSPVSVFPCEINAQVISVTTTCYIISRDECSKKRRRYEEIKRGKCPEPRKNRKSETSGKNGQVSDSRNRGTRYPPERKEKENIEYLILLKKFQKSKKGMYPLKRAQVELEFHRCYHHHHHTPFIHHTCTS